MDLTGPAAFDGREHQKLTAANTMPALGVLPRTFLCAAALLAVTQGTTEQNRTKQTNAQKQEKHTRTDKALSAEQAADFGMWQQSAAAPAR